MRHLTPLLLLALTPSLAAQDLPKWELGLGLAVQDIADYRGSDTRTTRAFPFPYLVYRGERLRIGRRLQGILFQDRRLRLSLSASASPPVGSDTNAARQGMPDLDRGVEIGPLVEYRITDPTRPETVWVSLAARWAATLDLPGLDHRGWVLEPVAGYERPGPLGTRLGARAGLLFADAGYHGYSYDVPTAFATSERPAYEAPGGYSGTRLGLSLDRRLGRLRWGLYLQYDYLGGTAFDDSPLVQTDHDLLVGANLAVVLRQSERRVPASRGERGFDFETPLVKR
jgi:outer membrane protein